ncbi:TraR/DksA family transcriptional regulator [Streptomyces lushanensis]|uniref:TraR/DksA family transcriptional regulator n=1 Tax=Streptomyces lushanensis TaxID=1434255 RepID=UPI00082E6291|nr:TraR/DksA C4-type zinc finger protein [Streptomyces lushanensis]
MGDSFGDAAFPATGREAAHRRLAAERAGTIAEIAFLSRDFAQIVEANALVAVDDEHDPEGSSTAFERAHVAALLARAEERLADLDRALERLERGDYGRCGVCGGPIPAERLEARPAASTCVPCAEARPHRPTGPPPDSR